MKRNIKLIIEYVGTNYHGWQSQIGSGNPTIQDALEHAISALAPEDGKTCSSGRTDAGVHALGHVANFKTGHGMPPAAWAPALNHLLPHDIRVLEAGEVPLDFHARFSASGKSYKYLILNRRAPSALYRDRAWHIPQKLNLTAMRRAGAHLLGTHDFSAFRSSGCGAKTPVRNLRALTIKKSGDFVEVVLDADAFLMHMARNIVGTLAEAGRGAYPGDAVRQMLLSRDRSEAGRTAPAHGLYLVKVNYP